MTTVFFSAQTTINKKRLRGEPLQPRYQYFITLFCERRRL